MIDSGKNRRAWQPLDEDLLNAIDDLFAEIFPESDYGGLAEDIADYWIERLVQTWKAKPDSIRQKDLAYHPDDPVSRILPRTVVIAYPDSVYTKNETSLRTLERFLARHFPAAGGLHILPACQVVEERFNDGYFSQVKRDAIHKGFGTKKTFSRLVERYFSMADFVLNHVDIENPNFRAYLEGDDDAGRCFYVFSENRYRRLSSSGAFDVIFRPRPFPLFTIFRRAPEDDIFARMDFTQRCAAVGDLLAPDVIDEAVIALFTVFEKIQNDQMLLDDDYAHITAFRKYLEKKKIPPDSIFRLSQSQESNHPPYIFTQLIRTRTDLLSALGYDGTDARRIAKRYEFFDAAVFGEQVRAMTTFSHVQVDVNTSAFEGLKMLADDFSWYLGLDINMLRLDAANYAFKKFHTSCFGLPEVKKLMKILYLSMDCVSPRIVANLEVNDHLGVVLSHMDDTDPPPPMMYDFHLPCMLPVVFNTGDARILDRIGRLTSRYTVPGQCIRFSLAESHDGKSVRGSMDLLRFSERRMLAETVEQNNGRIKYKAAPAGRCTAEEFMKICRETGMTYTAAVKRLFQRQASPGDDLVLKNGIETTRHIFAALGIKAGAPDTTGAIEFLADKVLHGREPYELCCSTRDSMVRIDDEKTEAKRFLGFYTLAFALMGRNVKSIYFNDMSGLPNDLERMKKTGEYRDIKRTRSRYSDLSKRISAKGGFHQTIAQGIDNLIHIVDNDMALHPQGNEAETLPSGNRAVAMVCNHFQAHYSLAIINTTGDTQDINTNFTTMATRAGLPFSPRWTDRFAKKSFQAAGNTLSISLAPYDRLWLKPEGSESR